MNQTPGLVPARSHALAAGPFSHGTYTIKRPLFSLLGRVFRVFDPSGNQILFVRHKVFTLKDAWSIFADESMGMPLVSVQARNVFGIDIVTDMLDAQTQQPLGAVKSKGLKSILKDTWEVLGPGDAVIGSFQEDSNALLRRFLPFLLGKWHLQINGREAARLHQVFRLFTKEFTLEVVPGAADPRFALACALLALTKEIGREK